MGLSQDKNGKMCHQLLSENDHPKVQIYAVMAARKAMKYKYLSKLLLQLSPSHIHMAPKKRTQLLAWAKSWWINMKLFNTKPSISIEAPTYPRNL